MNRTIKFRGKRVDNGEWVYGSLQWFDNGEYYIKTTDTNKRFGASYQVIPETVGQLRHTNKHCEYFDGDVYYHAGYGLETVSEYCELQLAVFSGNNDDIGAIKGNLHDTPELLNTTER